MTTPERLRRRQRIEGVFLVVIGVGTLLQFNYFHHQDQDQRDCLYDVIAAQNAALTARGDLAQQDSEINASESAATRGLIVDVFASKSSEEARDSFEKAVKQWAEVDDRRAEVKKKRAENPIPELPEGTCD